MADVALKTSSYLILGLVRGGMSSGYAIRRFISENQMSIFWATTFAQIYPELAQLEETGHLARRDDSQGARRRAAYTLTPKGERALMAWLRRAEIPPMELRDEGLLRLAFADLLAPDEALALVRSLRERAEAAEREFREEGLNTAEAMQAMGLRFPGVIGRIWADYNAWAVQRLTALEAELRDLDSG